MKRGDYRLGYPALADKLRQSDGFTGRKLEALLPSHSIPGLRRLSLLETTTMAGSGNRIMELIGSPTDGRRTRSTVHATASPGSSEAHHTKRNIRCVRSVRRTRDELPTIITEASLQSIEQPTKRRSCAMVRQRRPYSFERPRIFAKISWDMWDNKPFTQHERDLLFASSEGESSLHVITTV